MAIAAGKFKTLTVGKRKYKVDIVNRPSIPDNTKYWQVFEDDMQIKRFLELSSEFVNTQIENETVDSENFQDVDEDEEGVAETEKLKGSLRGKGIVQLKSNHIPRGLIPLENLFYQNDVVRYPKVKPAENDAEDKNIGTEDDPKIVKLSLLKKRKNM